MDSASLVSGVKYLYSPVIPGKMFDYCNLEQRRDPMVLTYSHESPYESDYHVFFDNRGEKFNICLYGFIVKEQVEPFVE